MCSELPPDVDARVRAELHDLHVLERLTGAGIGEDRARDAIERGRVRVAGHEEPVTDPDAQVPWPTAWEFLPS